MGEAACGSLAFQTNFTIEPSNFTLRTSNFFFPCVPWFIPCAPYLRTFPRNQLTKKSIQFGEPVQPILSSVVLIGTHAATIGLASTSMDAWSRDQPKGQK